jgi:peptidoglycan/LPS O-acetylase OafA/YrhL
MQYSGNRLIPLEGFRGIAAFIVLMEHFFLAFSPYTTGKIDILRNTESIIGQWFYVFFNGTAAVIFFFHFLGLFCAGHILTMKTLKNYSTPQLKGFQDYLRL